MKSDRLKLGLHYMILFLVTGCTSPPQTATDNNYNVLTIDSVQTKYDTIRLGKVNEGEILAGTFKLKNHYAKPMVIANVVTGCGCTTTQYDTKPIKTGEERLINFTFDTKGRQGWQLKSIDIVTTDKMMARIFIEADIIPSRN